MVHVQQVDEEESERMDREIDIMIAKKEKEDIRIDQEISAWQDDKNKKNKLYEEFEHYVNDSP
jgi:hypothetical protein